MGVALDRSKCRGIEKGARESGRKKSKKREQRPPGISSENSTAQNINCIPEHKKGKRKMNGEREQRVTGKKMQAGKGTSGKIGIWLRWVSTAQIRFTRGKRAQWTRNFVEEGQELTR